MQGKVLPRLLAPPSTRDTACAAIKVGKMLIKLKPDVHSVKQQDQQGAAAAEEGLKGRGRGAWPGQQLQIVFYSKCNTSISYSLMHN